MSPLESVSYKILLIFASRLLSSKLLKFNRRVESEQKPNFTQAYNLLTTDLPRFKNITVKEAIFIPFSIDATVDQFTTRKKH